MLTDMEIEKLSRRLRRIRGQIEGIERMINEHRYCVDVLQQIGAAQAKTLYQVGMMEISKAIRSW